MSGTIFILVAVISAVLGALGLGYRYGRSRAAEAQDQANARAMADALGRVAAAEARAEAREREARERADRAVVIHQEIERQRAELLAAFTTGDIERALSAWEEKQAQLAREINALN